MLEYQDIVHWLQEMGGAGLLGRLYIQTRANHSNEYVDSVMQGGLTVDGKQLLAEYE